MVPRRRYPAPVTAISNLLAETLSRNSYDLVSTTAGAVSIALLLSLLFYKEVLRATDRVDRGVAMRILDAGILPLLTTAGVVVTSRLAQLV
jgi:hypothetical protein